jgi:hypothetical protein
MEEMILLCSIIFGIVGGVFIVLISICLITVNKFTWQNILQTLTAGLFWPLVLYMAVEQFVEDDHNFPRPG